MRERALGLMETFDRVVMGVIDNGREERLCANGYRRQFAGFILPRWPRSDERLLAGRESEVLQAILGAFECKLRAVGESLALQGIRLWDKAPEAVACRYQLRRSLFAALEELTELSRRCGHGVARLGSGTLMDALCERLYLATLRRVFGRIIREARRHSTLPWRQQACGCFRTV